MSERSFLGIAAGVMLAVIFLSGALVSSTSLDFSTASTFVAKNVVLVLVTGALVYFHFRSASDTWSSYSSPLYWYAYPIVISLHFMSWWPVIRYTNMPDFIDPSRYLAWYQSYPFLIFCLLALLLGLELLMRKIINDWSD